MNAEETVLECRDLSKRFGNDERLTKGIQRCAHTRSLPQHLTHLRVAPPYTSSEMGVCLSLIQQPSKNAEVLPV